MIHPGLHRQPAALDRRLHRELRAHQPQPDWSFTAGLSALPVVGAEFGDACREYPILFVRAPADEQGRAQVLPIAALGLAAGENLYLDGTRWRAQYLPALLRAYPFGLGRLGDDGRALLTIDLAWSGLSRTEGTPLFDADGEPGPALRELRGQLERFEQQRQRTRELCRLLLDLQLLRAVRLDATVDGGEPLRVEGFLAVDEAKLAQLEDAALLALVRSGVLALLHAHQVSLGNLRKLLQWRLQPDAGAAA